MALFGEKYGDTVRVVEMDDFSKEFCGGTHVKNTNQIGSFKILSESGVAAGVRRIEAITGDNVRAYYDNLEQEIDDAAGLLKATPATLAEHIKKLQEELRAARSENESLKSKAAQSALGDVTNNTVDVKGVKFLAAKVSGVDMNELRNLGDDLKGKLSDPYVILLLSDKDGKVSMMVAASDTAVKMGAHAGNLIKGIAKEVGGGGGGRPNMAQAGGKNPAGIDKAMALAKTVLEEQIKA